MMYDPFQVKVTKKIVYAAIAISFSFCTLFHLVWSLFASNIIDGNCLAVGYFVSPAAQNVAGIYIFIMEYLFPVVAMTFCYGRIYHVLRSKVCLLNN